MKLYPVSFKFLLIVMLSWVTASFAGTLIVTYQTGINGERLERIRLLLKGKDKKHEMYPQNGAFVDDPANATRMVVIEELPAGDYILEFIVPNGDGLFEDVMDRHIFLKENSLVKIDQMIKVRYASIRAEAHEMQGNPTLPEFPTITLKDCSGFIQAQSSSGILTCDHLVPGKYTLVFDPISGYQTPSSIEVQLAPEEDAGPFIGAYVKLD